MGNMTNSIGHRAWLWLRAHLYNWNYFLYRRRHRGERQLLILKAIYESAFQYRSKLLQVRRTEDYSRVFEKQEPLVSVRVATFNNAQILAERAIASIRTQTYKNIEVIVVGDACTDDTENVIKKINDNRIRFMNMPYRGPYPQNKTDLWRVAGAPCMNMGVNLAKGDWICPLDDDDELCPTHVEDLLQVATRGRYEFVYGMVEIVINNALSTHRSGAYPPRIGQCPMQASIYLRLLDFVEYFPNAWLFDEPADWNLTRRYMEMGVRIGFLDKVVAKVYQADHRFR
jgi:glycosyltransferase involved in cell wall biosynthesis